MTTSSTLTRETVVTVRPFTRQRDGDDIIIGSAETGVFLAVPPEAIELLDDFAQRKSVGEVSDLYSQRHGETPDLEDFLSYLETKGIIALGSAQTGTSINPAESPEPPVRVRYHLTNFPQSLAQRIFSRPVLVFCCALAALAIALTIHDPSLAPRPNDYYFPDHRTVLWAFVVVFGYVTLFVHEFAHLTAARALGINSRMGIGHRLWNVVAETDLTGLWAVPKRQRYLPLLAGVIVDLASGSLMVIILFAQTRHWLPLPLLVVRMVRAMAFTYVLRIIWECMLFVRTDFYYVLASLLNCRSLLKDTEDFIRNLVARAVRKIRPVDQSAIPPAERRVIRIYAVVWFLGRVVALAVLSLVTIPLFVHYARNLASALAAGYSANPGNFFDALVFTFNVLIPVALGLTLWMRSLVRRARS